MTEIIKQRYQLLDKLGQGGFGAVYKAFDRVLSREVAIKLLNLANENQEEMVLRFQVESRVASRLEHQNILRVYDFGRDDNGRCFLVSELLKGDSLHAHLKAKKQLPLSLAIDILYQVGSALELAHEQNTVHRDIKPPNIFLKEPMRGASFVKLLDFGIAKVMGGDESLTVTGQIMGTPHYMSPEQIVNIKLVDHRSDIYSLGVVFYQMVMGSVPFDDESYFTIMKHHMQTPMPELKLPDTYPPELERELNDLVKSMTRKDVRKRVKQISEVLYKVQQIWSAYAGILRPITTGVFRSISSHSLTQSSESPLESIGSMLQPFEGADQLIDQLLNEVDDDQSSSQNALSPSLEFIRPISEDQVTPSASEILNHNQLNTEQKKSILIELSDSPALSSQADHDQSIVTSGMTSMAPTLSSDYSGASRTVEMIDQSLESQDAQDVQDVQDAQDSSLPLEVQNLDTILETPRAPSIQLNLTRTHLIVLGLFVLLILIGIWWGIRPATQPSVQSSVQSSQENHSSPKNPKTSEKIPIVVDHPNESATDLGMNPEDTHSNTVEDLDQGVKESLDQALITDAEMVDQVKDQEVPPTQSNQPNQSNHPSTHHPSTHQNTQTPPPITQKVSTPTKTKPQKISKNIQRKRNRSRNRKPKLNGEIKLLQDAGSLGYEVGQTVKLKLPSSAKEASGKFSLGCATWKSKDKLEITFNRASSRCVISYCERRDCIQSRKLEVSKPLPLFK